MEDRALEPASARAVHQWTESCLNGVTRLQLAQETSMLLYKLKELVGAPAEYVCLGHGVLSRSDAWNSLEAQPNELPKEPPPQPQPPPFPLSAL